MRRSVAFNYRAIRQKESNTFPKKPSWAHSLDLFSKTIAPIETRPTAAKGHP